MAYILGCLRSEGLAISEALSCVRQGRIFSLSEREGRTRKFTAPLNPSIAQSKIPFRLENRQTITLAKHAVFDLGQLLLDNEGPGLGGKQMQRRAITQRGLGLAQPSRGIRGLSSKDLLGAGGDARDPDIVTYFSRSH